MSDTFESFIFGMTRNATGEEQLIIADAVKNTPVSVFQELNKAFNERGFCISIAKLDETN